MNNWFPSHPPLYDIHKTYEENAAFGPFFQGPLLPRVFPPKEEWIDFLGYSIASAIGIPAGPLLTANWVTLAAKLGFDVLTYKTIRSKEHPAHPLPNMLYVQTEDALSPQERGQAPLHALLEPSSDIQRLAVTNSFGMPSKSPSFLREDIPKANASLQEGQILIVSVVGTSRKEIDFLTDFVDAARLAKEAGAKIIEANFSCPNVDKKEGCLYMSPEVIKEIGTALVKAIHPLPLIIKVGLFSSPDQMRDVFLAAARSGIRAICGINTISRQVIDEKGHSALGPGRLTSGICGGPIHKAALKFIKDAAKINASEKLDLTLMGVGGVTLPNHFDQFLEAGAHIAMTATGMMWDPYLASHYHASHQNQKV